MIIDNKIVSCTPYEILNLARGVVYSKDLMKYSEETLAKNLKTQRVVKIEKIRNKIDGILTPPVRPYEPLRRRCYYCQFFGYVGRNCKQRDRSLPAICERCKLALDT